MVSKVVELHCERRQGWGGPANPVARRWIKSYKSLPKKVITFFIDHLSIELVSHGVEVEWHRLYSILNIFQDTGSMLNLNSKALISSFVNDLVIDITLAE